MQRFNVLYRAFLTMTGRVAAFIVVLMSTASVTYAVNIQIPDNGTFETTVAGSVTNLHDSSTYNTNGDIGGGIQSITPSEPSGVYYTDTNNAFQYGVQVFSRLSDNEQFLSAYIKGMKCDVVDPGQYEAQVVYTRTTKNYIDGLFASLNVSLEPAYNYQAGSWSTTLSREKTFLGKWSKGHSSVVLKASSDAQLAVAVKSGAIPGAYALKYRMSCTGNDNPSNQAAYLDVDFNFNLVARPTSCSITPPQTVNFGDNILTNETDTQIATAQTVLQTSCDVGNGSADINRGMYLTFEPGSHGLYESNAKKLATDNQSLYITGGTDSSTSSCNTSTMTFNGAVNADYKLKVLTVGVNNAQKQLYFSLCHDTSKQLTSGNVRSDAKVNLVIQ